MVVHSARIGIIRNSPRLSTTQLPTPKEATHKIQSVPEQTQLKQPSSTPVVRVRQTLLLPMMVGAALLLAALYFLDAHSSHSLLARLDQALLDVFHANGRKTPARDDIMLLAIDSASLSLGTERPEDIEQSAPLQAIKSNPWPWPRRVWAATIDKLSDAGVRCIFLDLAFVAPSPDPEDDRLLREAIERHKDKVILGAKFDDSTVHGEKNSELKFPTPTITGRERPEDGTFGVLNFWGDGTLRSAVFQITRTEAEMRANPGELFVADPDEKPLPSIAMAIARKVDPAAAAKADTEETLRFAPVDSFKPISLFQIFVPEMWAGNFADGAPLALKDKIVLIGATAQELQDYQNTPLGSIAGVQVHAHALNALLASSFLRSINPNWLWLWIALGALGAWSFVTFIKQPVLSLLALWCTTITVVWACYHAFNHYGLEISPLPACFALNFCGIVGIAGNFVVQMRETKRLQRFLARYTSPELAAEMLRDRAGLYTTLRGAGRTVTMLFSDVRGFTSMSEGMTPEQMVSQLNEYLSRMVERVFMSRGLVDKFIGDAVMALWGSTRVDQGAAGLKEDARQAVTTALAMRTALHALNSEWQKRGLTEFRIGIGVHQGPVVVGNIGSESPFEKMDFTVIGDSVNLCSRLESETKNYGCDIIISSAVCEHVREEFLCRPLGFVTVKGKAIPVKIYQVVERRNGANEPEWWHFFEEGVQALQSQDNTRAKELLQRCLEAAPDDALTAKMLREC